MTGDIDVTTNSNTCRYGKVTTDSCAVRLQSNFSNSESYVSVTPVEAELNRCSKHRRLSNCGVRTVVDVNFMRPAAEVISDARPMISAVNDLNETAVIRHQLKCRNRLASDTCSH